MAAPLRLAYETPGPGPELRIRLSAGDRPLGTAWFRACGGTLTPDANALFCLGLYPASELGTTLEIAGAVDPALLARAGQISGLFRDWWPGCRPVTVRPVTVHAQTAPAAPDPGRGTAAFFSGGIDSGFTLTEARPRLTALITLLGVDTPLSDPVATARFAALSGEIAGAEGLEHVVIETNVAEVLHPFASWIELHGSALAAIGHMLSHRIGRVLIASSGDEMSWHIPWGSHPALDPLFGSAALAIEHHGLVARIDKIARIAESALLLPRLRVCNKAAGNCGICDKCTFAMRALDLLGALGRAESFPRGAGEGAYRIVDDGFLSEMVKLRAAAARAGRADLLPEMDMAIARYRRRAWRRATLGPLRCRLRVAKHRMRYRRAAA